MSVSPPRPKGPPLNALRAFEAAARLGGFANASEELGVTPGAISQHIKALEDWVGVALFERRSQGVKLTETGADLAPEFGHAFDAMGAAVRHLRSRAKNRTLHIAALPSIAQLWLSPRLPQVRKALPNLGLSVSATELPPNLSREMFDLSLFFKAPEGHGREVVLAPDVITPVCAPELAKQLKTPEDLVGQTLLHDALWPGDWALWARSVGVDLPGLNRGPSFSLYAVALEEAKHGAGVLIGHKALVAGALARGELVAPFTAQITTPKSLVLETAVRPKPGDDLARITALLAG
ncbi:LysR family transcriptional regulator [uncultured Roseovarius sp.]|uniref:LysR family transcriptional regulator n=1 Tax=uncultured Roseovarius sp. TaxID=293344 RepID=UPI002621E186|nr:LysR family transcriptional regulator [uncultured Roseovarius sp.]